MSIGVTYSTRLDEYRIYDESMADQLIEQLTQADLVIGFNHINFDYEVLQKYTAWDINSQAVSLDLMVDIEKRIEHRLKLDAIASASLGIGKTAVGVDAIKWWRQGEIMKIAEYCCHDVKVTWQVHTFGVRNGFVKYADRSGQMQKVEVEW